MDQISHAGIVIRIWIKTAPSQQWAIAGELRRRLNIDFDRNHIQIGSPQQRVLESSDTLDPTKQSQTIEQERI